MNSCLDPSEIYVPALLLIIKTLLNLYIVLFSIIIINVLGVVAKYAFRKWPESL